MVLERLEQAGMRLKRQKCSFMLPSVQYLGHCLSAEGVSPTEDKVQAIREAPRPEIREAPRPENVSQLKSFLGLVTYYTKFLKNLSSLVAPLNSLLGKNVQWKWSTEQEDAFNQVKAALTSSDVLIHYDPEKEIITFASRSLSPAEKNYSQLDREGLAIVFGVKRFHQYLCGRQFTIYTDHKPLEAIFSSNKQISAMASAHTKRWALTLSMYDYNVKYKKGKEIPHADSLSRLPLPDTQENTPTPGELVLLLEMLENSPVTSQMIQDWTSCDPVLSRVVDMVLGGWPEVFTGEDQEVSVQGQCLLWGSRVVIPQRGRDKTMALQHEGHPGTSRMKKIGTKFCMVAWNGQGF